MSTVDADLLSIVIPAYNAASTIGAMLESLAQQSASVDWEVVVAENGSTDATRALVATYCDRLPSLRIVDASASSGAAYARNLGVREAKGDQIVFLDADDEVGTDFIQAVSRALTHCDAIAVRLAYDRLNPSWLSATRGPLQTTGLSEWWLGDYLAFAAGTGIGVKRKVHNAIGGFDEDLTQLAATEDMDYCWRLQLAGFTLTFVPEAVVEYRLRSSFGDLYRQARAYGHGIVSVYAKHRPLGMPAVRHPFRQAVVGWIRALRHVVLISRKDRRARLAWDLGIRVGLLRGSISHRVFLL